MKPKRTNLRVFIAFVILSILITQSNSTFGQTNSYSSRQVINGQCNNNTSVITIEYLSDGSVKATRTVRSSIQTDSISLYNLTSDSLIKVGNKAKLKLTQNRWFIPFEGAMALRTTTSGDSEAHCNCMGEGKCNLTVKPGIMSCDEDGLDPCDGCCEMTITWSGVVVTGSGIFVDAKSVNYIR